MSGAGDRHGRDAATHAFPREFKEGRAVGEGLSIEDLDDVRLNVTAELGRAAMLVRDVLDLKRGSVLQLDKLAGEMTDIRVNDMLIGKGEVVVLGDNLHIRVAEIIGADEKDTLFNE